MLPLALSTRWNAHRHEDGFAMLQEIRRLGFPAVEIGSAWSIAHWPGLLKAREKNLIEIWAMQADSADPKVRFLTKKRGLDFAHEKAEVREAARHSVETTLRQARDLGARTVILSLGKSGQTGITAKLLRLEQQGRFLDRAYTQIKVQAVRERRELFPVLWARVQPILVSLVDLAGEFKITLALKSHPCFEDFPQEEERAEILAHFPASVVGAWHDFGPAAQKDFLGWQTTEEILPRQADRLVGYHVQDWRRPQQTPLSLSHGEIEVAPLLPLLPKNAMAVLELAHDTPEEQVMASRHLWNSYVDALV